MSAQLYTDLTAQLIAAKDELIHAKDDIIATLRAQLSDKDAIIQSLRQQVSTSAPKSTVSGGRC